jgi:hypothetical protein
MKSVAPGYLVLIAGALSGAGLLLSQPYSVFSPWRVYNAPARRFLAAAARQDSAELVRLTADPAAAAWALAAAREHADSLAVWAREADAWAGNRQDGATEVFLGARSTRCDLVLRFVGRGSGARVAQARSACLEAPRPRPR